MSGWASSPPQVRIPSPTAFTSLPRRSPVPPSSRCFRLAASRFIPPPPLPSSRSRPRPRSHPDPSRSRASQGYGGGVLPGSPPNHGGFGVPDGQSIPAYEPNAMPSHSGQMNHRGGGGALCLPAVSAAAAGSTPRAASAAVFPASPWSPNFRASASAHHGDKFRRLRGEQLRQDVSPPVRCAGPLTCRARLRPEQAQAGLLPFPPQGLVGAHPRAEPGRSRIQTPAQRHQRPGSLRRRRLFGPTLSPRPRSKCEGATTPRGEPCTPGGELVFWAGAAIFLWMAPIDEHRARSRGRAPLGCRRVRRVAFPLSAFAVWTKIILAGWSGRRRRRRHGGRSAARCSW